MKKIQRNEVHLWFVYDKLVTDVELLQSYEALLSLDEQARMQRFMFPQHQHQFLLTRVLVRTVLSEVLGLGDPTELVFEKNDYGKPSLAAGTSPTSLKFNLSHTDGLIVLAVMLDKEDDVELGVDIEMMTRKAEVLKLADRYFSKEENNELKALEASQQQKRFFDLWTLKESYIKACGKGLAIPLGDFSFHLSEELINISFSSNLKDNPQHWRFWQFDMDGEYRTAIALNGESLKNYQLVCKQGVPLQGYEQIKP